MLKDNKGGLILKYEVEKNIFEKYPGYCRAVVVAKDLDNTGEDEDLRRSLAQYEAQVRENPEMENYKEIPNIAAWREVFRDMGLNPNKFPPSIANLIKRTYAGKDLPFINKLVTIFNIISLKYITPCGGDDLDAVKEDIRLGIASGDEEYVPLGQPDKMENPTPGEVIYYDTGDRDVFCRGWCWKNGDRSKIMPETKNVAINIEALPPLEKDRLEIIASELAAMVEKYCNGRTEIHFLEESSPSFEIQLQ